MNEHCPEQQKDTNWKAPEENTKTTPLDFFRKFHTSTVGRMAKSVGGVAIAVGSALGATSGYEFARGNMSREEAWKLLEQESPSIHQIEYKTLQEVPPQQKAEILDQRDTQFTIQRDAAIADLRTTLTQSGVSVPEIENRINAILKNIGDYRPSQYDRMLEELQIPVIVNSPYPVIRFRPNMKGRNFEEGFTASGQQKKSFGIDPDTLLIDPEPSTVGVTLRHEELHERQSNAIHTFSQQVKNVVNLEQHSSSNLNLLEGSTEYLRNLLDTKLGYTSLRHVYTNQQAGVDIAIQLIGEKHFWKLYGASDFSGIIQAIDHQQGSGTSDILFSGGSAQLNMTPGFSKDEHHAFDTFHKLSEMGILTAERIAHAREHVGQPVFEDVDRFLVGSRGEFLGSVTINEIAIHIAIDSPNGGIDVYSFAHPQNDIGWSTAIRPVSEFPELEKICREYFTRLKVINNPSEQQHSQDDVRKSVKLYLENNPRSS